MATKAARIRELYSQGKTTREIADLIGCTDSYVRVCARQRSGGGYSAIDKRYLAAGGREKKNKHRRYAYATDEGYRERARATQRRWYARNRASELARMKDYKARRRAASMMEHHAQE